MCFHEFRLVLFVIASALSCNDSKNHNNMLKINGLIKDYILNASHDTFDDGSFVVFDAVKISLIKPDTMKNQMLTIYLTKEEAKDIKWHQKGNVVSFSIDASLLEGDSILFLGAIENLTIQIK